MRPAHSEGDSSKKPDSNDAGRKRRLFRPDSSTVNGGDQMYRNKVLILGCLVGAAAMAGISADVVSAPECPGAVYVSRTSLQAIPSWFTPAQQTEHCLFPAASLLVARARGPGPIRSVLRVRSFSAGGTACSMLSMQEATTFRSSLLRVSSCGFSIRLLRVAKCPSVLPFTAIWCTF